MKLTGITDKIVVFDKGHAMDITVWSDWMDDMEPENSKEDDVVLGFEAPDIYEKDDLKESAKQFEALFDLSMQPECEGYSSYEGDFEGYIKNYYVFFRLDKWKQLKERINHE